MGNTHEGGLKVAEINRLKNPNYYRDMGHLGGRTQTDKTKLRGFGSDPKLASKTGTIGGRLSKRGKAKFKPSTICRDEVRLLSESWSADEIIANWRSYDSK